MSVVYHVVCSKLGILHVPDPDRVTRGRDFDVQMMACGTALRSDAVRGHGLPSRFATAQWCGQCAKHYLTLQRDQDENAQVKMQASLGELFSSERLF
jgi:hypothetical protein